MDERGRKRGDDVLPTAMRWVNFGRFSCADEAKSDVRNGVSFTVAACTSLHDAGLPTQLDATHAVDGMFLSAAKNAILLVFGYLQYGF
nr:hypothetical protein [Tanacetum cinerariifolium]